MRITAYSVASLWSAVRDDPGPIALEVLREPARPPGLPRAPAGQPCARSGDDGLRARRREAAGARRRGSGWRSTSFDTACGRRDGVARAVDHAVALRASVVGLGPVISSVTAGGVSLRHRTDVAVTNGDAFTAAVVYDQASDLVARREAGRVAIVGATGSVGSTVAKMFTRNRDADEVVLVADNERRLDSLRCNLSGRGVAVRSSADLEELRSADVVVLLAGSGGSLLEPQHLGQGAVVLDATQARGTTTKLAGARPDVRILEGAVVSIPSLEIHGGNVGLPNGRASAAFAEAALLALSGHQGHFSIGVPRLEQVDVVRSLARDHAHLGFTVAALTSFGVPVRPEVEGAVA